MIFKTKRRFFGFLLVWALWHWGLLLFGFLPYPQPRLMVLTSALYLDGLCFAIFIWEVIMQFRTDNPLWLNP